MIYLREETKMSSDEHTLAISVATYINLFDNSYFVRVEDDDFVAYVCATFDDKSRQVIWREKFSNLAQAIDFVNVSHLCDSGKMEDDAWPAYHKRYNPNFYKRVYGGK